MLKQEMTTKDGRRKLRCTDRSNELNGEALFDRCFLMNVPESVARYENFKQHLDGFDFGLLQVVSPMKVFDCPAGWSPGGWSQFLTVLTILIQSHSRGYRRILILEDDYECPPDFSNRVVEAMRHVPPDWDVASFLGFGVLGDTTVYNHFWRCLANHCGQQCVAYNIEALFSRPLPFFEVLSRSELWVPAGVRGVYLMDRSSTKNAEQLGLKWYTVCNNIGEQPVKFASDLLGLGESD